MNRIHAEMLRANRIYLGFFEGFGYLYQSGFEMFVYNGKGLNKL